MKKQIFFAVLLGSLAVGFSAKAYDKEKLNLDCERLCGQRFFYDRPGAKRNGKELVCTRYKLSCGYKCTIGWDIRYLVEGTNYTCQDAIQMEAPEDLKSLLKARSL